MKRINVYDAVNRDRLLGTMDRWSTPRGETHRNFACYPDPAVACSMAMMPELSVDIVRMEKVTKLSKDGWDAEVIVITGAPLIALCCIHSFQPATHRPGYPMMDVYCGPYGDYYGEAAREMHRRDVMRGIAC